MGRWLNLEISFTASLQAPGQYYQIQRYLKTGESKKPVRAVYKMKNEKFIGSWDLKKWTAELNDGTIVFPFGEDATGRITYDSNGDMSVQLMKRNRPKFLSEDPLQAKPEEMIIAYQDFLSYCGSYEVHKKPNQVVHQIKISSFPNWTGQNQIRKFEFKDDKLILSTDTIGSAKHKLVWQKMKKNN